MHIDVCSGEIMKTWRLIGYILLIIKIAVPIVLIVMGSIDMMKAVMAAKEDDIKKSQGMFIKRTIAAIIVFFVPTIVNLILNVIGGSEYKNSECIKCVLDVGTCVVDENGATN